jgi:predicted ATPase
MIRRVKFENFKALRNVEITFDERLTVLVGPNGSGKSSVLRGIHLQGLIAQENLPLDDVFSGPYHLRNICSGPRGSRSVFETDCSAPDWPFGFQLVVPGDGGRYFVSDGQVVHVNWNWVRLRAEPAANTVPAESITRYQSSLKSATLVRFMADQLSAPSKARSILPSVAKDGSDLASTLWTILGNEPDRFGTIERAFKRIIKPVRGVRFGHVRRNGSGPDDPVLDQILIDYQDAKGVPAVAVSDGTLFVLGLLTVVCGSDSIRTVLCDDLDHGLHPKAQMELLRVLRELMVEIPDLQIIATSHSPYVLSEVPVDAVRVMALRDDGSAVCARLDEHRDYDKWKEHMTPGEFWSHTGEDWVKNLAPQAQVAP